MTSGGRKRSQRAIVVVGNGNGAAGFAVGKGQSGISSLKKVRSKTPSSTSSLNQVKVHHSSCTLNIRMLIPYKLFIPFYFSDTL